MRPAHYRLPQPSANALSGADLAGSYQKMPGTLGDRPCVDWIRTEEFCQSHKAITQRQSGSTTSISDTLGIGPPKADRRWLPQVQPLTTRKPLRRAQPAYLTCFVQSLVAVATFGIASATPCLSPASDDRTESQPECIGFSAPPRSRRDVVSPAPRSQFLF